MGGLKEGCGSARAALSGARDKASLGFDRMLSKTGMGEHGIDLIHHLLAMLKDQVLAVLPISLLQIFVLLIFFQVGPADGALQAMGLALAIFGLVLFLEGLRVCVMPMAEQLGSELPKRIPLVGTLAVAFFLGVLVTYAEPAIAALRPLGELVDPREAPYLYYVMNKQQEFLVLAIGMGVGVAAVFGTLRFICNWPLKPLIFAALVPTLGCACYMQWGNPDLAPLLGMSWDCGAVTTGPVTVPILLALGIGVMQSQKAKRLATAALQSSVAANAGQALEGFGIVTLASLLPILAVELMSIIISVVHSYDDVLKYSLDHYNQADAESNTIDESPVKEIIFGVRSILPLIAALLLLTAVFLRKGPPRVSWWLDAREEQAPPQQQKQQQQGEDGAEGGNAEGGDSVAQLPTQLPRRTITRHSTYAGLERASMAVAAAAHFADGGSVHGGSLNGGSVRNGSQFEDSAHGDKNFDDKGGDTPKEEGDVEAGVQDDKPTKPSCGARLAGAPAALCRGLRNNSHFIVAVISAQVGMILFNIGLTYGFTALGNQTGTTLPAAYLEVPWYDWSPKYSYAGGLILVIVVLFLLGVLATRAEPALLVLGRTVEKLSRGAFTAKMLVGSVCLGVGVGLVAGSLKILYQLPLIYFILAKYTVAVGLTLITADSITAVAWDSAGVTTGPVTVPFVLSIGIGFSKAVGGNEGFGMLTVMSVAPIISVLLVALMRKPVKAVAHTVTASFKRAASSRQSKDGGSHTGGDGATVEAGGGDGSAEEGGQASDDKQKVAAEDPAFTTIAEGEEEEAVPPTAGLP